MDFLKPENLIVVGVTALIGYILTMSKRLRDAETENARNREKATDAAIQKTISTLSDPALDDKLAKDLGRDQPKP